MPTAIGLRFYKIFPLRLRDRGREAVDASDLNLSLPSFLDQFVADRTDEDAVSDAAKERAFYFEPLEKYGDGCTRGYVRYGTYGFESIIKKLGAKEAAYKRKSDDVEEIPLYFDIWSPPGGEFSILSFQSFGIRSCIQLVLIEMQKHFESANPGYRLHTLKLMGNDSPQTLFANAPVKKITFIRHNAYSDRFSSYRDGKPPKAIDLEVSYKAKRGGSLGRLRDVGGSLSQDEKGVILFDGDEFDEATAEVLIGKRRRPVGIVGPNSDTGTIDISEAVIYGPSGHPTFPSVRDQSNAIMQDFYTRLLKA